MYTTNCKEDCKERYVFADTAEAQKHKGKGHRRNIRHTKGQEDTEKDGSH